ncbi:MAG: ATP-binding protein [Lachnospiraceae bacterium]|nr:ATP-binding protein [Lachnospiraceae bacterium]
MNDADFRSIMAEYDEIRDKNSRLLEDRKKEVLEKLPQYKELEDRAALAAFSAGKKSMEGDSDVLTELDKELNKIAGEKEKLLTAAGFPRDYLMPIYDCPDCKDTGFIGNEKCHCLKQRIINSLYRQSHLNEILERENFETSDLSLFSPGILPDIRQVYMAAKDFVKTFAQSSRNMLFLGGVGSGKTFLTNCIAKELLDGGYSVVYFTAFRLFELIADHTFRDAENGEREGFFSNIYDSDLLIIDDLGTENTNSFVAGQLFNILNEREIRRKSTIISSNLALKSIKDLYSERSLSRIISNYELYYFRGEDLRMKKKG